MHSTKKITKEDTWRPAELRRHISEKVHEDGYTRRRDDSERKHRGGESTERRHRDPEESRRERDKLRERDGTKERKDGHTRDRYVEHRREGSQDQRGNRDVRDDRDRNKREVRDRRHDRESEKRRLVDDNEGNGDRAADKEQTRDRERHRDRHKDKEKERVRDRERDTEENRDKRRKERDKEKWREKRDKEHRSERRRHEESGQERRDETEKQHREQRDRRHRDNYQDRKKDRDLQERHGDRKHSEQKEEREHKEHRRHKEERERRHKERGHHDEKSAKTSGESVRQSRSDKDREEKDKHKERLKKEEADADRRYKERRHREEEEDVKRNLGDRTNWKKSSSDKSHRGDKEEETKDVEVVSEHWTADLKDKGDAEELVDNDEDLAEQEYEDDFEDYEEDFEEMDESADDGKDEKDSDVEDEKEELSAQQRKEIEAIRRAMAEENERAGTARSRQSTNREEEDKWSKDSEKNPIKSSQRGKFINFVAAKQREVNEKVATKQKKRSTELLRLIDLDFSMAFSLLDLPPVNEYEMYIRSFGNTNTKQAYVQCNEDNSDREIQTEETEMCEKWTQHPPELSGACGDPNFSQEAQYKTTSELSFDSQSLTSFLNSASQVVAVLLEEDEAERKSLRKLKTKAESLSFSDGSLQLNTNLPFLLGRHISLVHFSQVQRHTMLSVHLPTAKPSAARLDSSTVICIWNIWEPSRPQKILLYESEVQCCCFSPGKSTLVFAGSSVGSVLLWDLREQASNHYRLKIGEDEWTFRQPTFSTDAVMVSSGHFSPVTSVEVVPSTVAGVLSLEVPLLASEEESSGLSFQLASLDESGVLNFWVVLELPKGNEAGSPTDLGLRPGGKVKLLHSSSLLTADRASPKDAVKTRPLQTLLLKFLPTDSNHFFIGTNLGLVSHGTSHGLKAPPKFYRFQEVDERPVDIVSIHFSPFRPHLFLVGCGDGSIRLHEFSRDQPVAEWRNSTAGQQVVSLQWAQTRPTVFCVLDAASNLHIWDLLKDNAQPVLTERMNTDRVTAMSVFGDSGQQSTYSGVALAHELGKIELHYFTRSFTQSSSAEEEKLESLMTDPF